MKNGKPKGRVPSLIGSTLGRPRRVLVEKLSECKRCKSKIGSGQDCIGIPHLGGSFTNLKRYCTDCFRNILEKTKQDVMEVEKLL